MRASTVRAPAPLVLPQIPLLESGDLPDDDWTLPLTIGRDDGGFDEDRYATLSVARAFDD